MKKGVFLTTLLLILSSGCATDIVVTDALKQVEPKCVHIEPIQSDDPYVGQVLRDILEKELLRKNVKLCDPESATIFLSGSTFVTNRTPINGKTKTVTNQCIESVSLIAKDRDGQILLSASYDNKEQFTASKIGMEFGRMVADKLK